MDDKERKRKNRVVIRFYEELNDFLRGCPKKRDLEAFFWGTRSVKDLIESFGVPHVEVDLVLVNGAPAGFDRLLRDGDRVSVYPVFERLDIAGVSRLGRPPLRDPRFVLDVHLGKLARHLRLLGFDALWERNWEDREIASVAKAEGRIVLTRDRGLLMRSEVERGLAVRSDDPYEQCVEVLRRLDLWDRAKPFSRCLVCNGRILEVAEPSEFKTVFETLPPRVKAWCRELYQCEACGRIYWKGSHWEAMEAFVHRILSSKEE